MSLSAALFKSQYPIDIFLSTALENTDNRIRDNKPVTPAFIFAVLLWFPMMKQASNLQKQALTLLPAIEIIYVPSFSRAK